MSPKNNAGLKTGVLSGALKLVGLGSIRHSKGYFQTAADLITAHPTGVAGDWAIIGDTDTVWVWDTGTNAWVDTGHGSIVNWGDIGGSLPDQTDLQDGLNDKEDLDNKVGSFQATPDDTHYPTEKLVYDSLNEKRDKIIENIDVTGDRTLSDTDAFKRLSLIDDGNQTITVPTNANESIPVDTEIVLQGYGTGTKTIEPDTDVTLNGGTSSFVLDSQYSGAVLRKIGTNEWLIVGAVN